MSLRVAAIQHDIVWEDKVANFVHLRPLIAKAAGDGARLVLLSEMFSTGFSMNTAVVAEPMDGPSIEFLEQQAAEYGVPVGGSIPVLRPDYDKPVNQFTLAVPSGNLIELCTYAKIHPFSFGSETEHYAAGTSVNGFGIDGVHMTPFVCYDLRFADVFWNAATSTDLYVVVANWPASRAHHWKTLLTARAIENQAWVVGVNRVGQGGGLDYAGDTRIIDPMGEIVAAAQTANEEIVTADIDVDQVRQVRTRFPFLDDR